MICLMLAASCLTAGAQSMNFMTFNIRYATVNDGPDQWEMRKESVCELIEEEAPLVVGIQEGLHEQVQFMDQSLREYAYLGVGRDTGKEEGEYCAIFYSKEKLEVLDWGTFWLSDTPDQPSIGWDASYKRICTYAIFRHLEMQQSFLVLNTHFDHMGVKARDNSASLLLERLEVLNKADHPVILMGDFNLTEDSEPIKKIRTVLEDTRIAAREVKGPEATFNGFDLQKEPAERIDYIFFGKKKLKVLESRILDKKYQGRYPSDHFPVAATVEIISK
jgi:endonuclease/exonuclease/phosphatase family metal-dependent hydrolase